MCRLLGRCHPIDAVTSVVGDVPDALSEQVCHASVKMGRYDCGPGYVCLKGDQEPELVRHRLLAAVEKQPPLSIP